MDFQNKNLSRNIAEVDQRILDIKTSVLGKVTEAIKKTDSIEAAVKRGWDGPASDQFIRNLNKTKEEMIETLKQLQSAFEVELKGLKSASLNLDTIFEKDE